MKVYFSFMSQSDIVCMAILYQSLQLETQNQAAFNLKLCHLKVFHFQS